MEEIKLPLFAKMVWLIVHTENLKESTDFIIS